MRLSKSSTNITTSGQIINLLSNDVARFEQLFIAVHYIWILPIQGTLITFMIWKSVGIASLAGVFLISIQTIPLQGMYIAMNYIFINFIIYYEYNSFLLELSIVY